VKDIIIRDPIHGDISLCAHEQLIIDTPQMQRLRGIRQLGTAYLVYPGSQHTRFEHSLGTMHTVAKILSFLDKKAVKISDDDKTLLRVAGLVHDVGHIPFGHTFEDERRVFSRHDNPRRFQYFLGGGELGQVLKELGLQESVMKLLLNNTGWQSQIVSGTIDADLLDYLKRDAYYTGISQSYDERVYRYFTLSSDNLALHISRGGVDRSDARSEVEHLLRMRYFLTERVYLHHAKIISGAMISKAVELAVNSGLKEEDLYFLTDFSLLDQLSNYWGDEAGYLAKSVLNRKLYKRAYGLSANTIGEGERWELSRSYHHNIAQRQALETQIANAVGIPSYQVIVYVSAPTFFKEATVPVIIGDEVMPFNRLPVSHLNISGLEEEYRRLWRFWIFTPAPYIDAISHQAEAILGIPSEH
jgi:HD superfamily phosphohydrolase